MRAVFALVYVLSLAMYMVRQMLPEKEMELCGLLCQAAAEAKGLGLIEILSTVYWGLCMPIGDCVKPFGEWGI
ncbi:hypothetical protein ColKHC_09837 [Colletotrichum higginsianum]|nr:hypothetical protein ColKHC_09837 [Colletotrichum higginsianum]